MKPGRPLAYGRIGEAHFFGLPGNPVSAMVTFYQFVREALLVLMGVPEPAPLPVLKAVCTTPIKKAPGRTEFQRGILSPGERRSVDRASDRRPGLRHPVLDEPGQLLHHPARCPGQYPGGGDRGRAAAGRPDLIAADVTGVVLAGGRGQRVGGLDKGWIELGGRPLIAHVLARFAPQVSEVIISANRNLDRYAGFGHAVVADETPGFAGPLAGLLAGFSRARFGLVCTVPCDSPFVPLDLVVRLHSALQENAADVAVARTADRIHPVFALYRRDLRADLARLSGFR